MKQLLSEPNWRGGTPEDIWMESYLSASGCHRKVVHEVMKKYSLTLREAMQRVYKCDEIAAQHDTIYPESGIRPSYSD